MSCGAFRPVLCRSVCCAQLVACIALASIISLTLESIHSCQFFALRLLPIVNSFDHPLWYAPCLVFLCPDRCDLLFFNLLVPVPSHLAFAALSVVPVLLVSGLFYFICRDQPINPACGTPIH